MTYMYAGLRDWPISYRLVFSYGYQLVRMAVQVRRNLLRNIDIIGCTTTGMCVFCIQPSISTYDVILVRRSKVGHALEGQP
jgi:hypothetical protein